MNLLYNFIIAFAMYSKIPMPRIDWTEERMRYSMCFFPLIGAVIGAVMLLWARFGMAVTGDASLYGAIMVLIPIVITGGIHLDGLLDTADALSSYKTMEEKLEILKDSHAGAFAIIVGICYFLFYLGVCSEVNERSLPVICLGFVFARGLGAFSIASFPMAKNTGLAATFSDGAQKRAVRITSVFFVAVTGIGMILLRPLIGCCVLAGTALEYLYYYKMSQKEFGGITGDLAGFHMQLCELVVAFCAVLGQMMGG